MILRSSILALGLLTSTCGSAETDKNSSYFIKATALKAACVMMDAAGRGQGPSDNDTLFAVGRCYGAILGIVDSITLQPLTTKGQVKGVDFCLPPELDAGQVAMKLATAVSRAGPGVGVPKDLFENAPAVMIVAQALRQTFPCTG